jgi:anti-sigma-K factor RskA
VSLPRIRLGERPGLLQTAAMTSDGERFSRAGSYVLGLMDEHARERAERDMEVDPAFRDAVLKIAERMHKIDLPAPQGAADHWKAIATHISGLPQMRGAAGHAATVTHIQRTRPVGQGLYAVPTRQSLIIALGLIAAFVAGYLAALASM